MGQVEALTGRDSCSSLSVSASCPYMILFQVHLPCQQSCLIAADPRTEMNGCPYS